MELSSHLNREFTCTICIESVWSLHALENTLFRKYVELALGFMLWNTVLRTAWKCDWQSHARGLKLAHKSNVIRDKIRVQECRQGKIELHRDNAGAIFPFVGTALQVFKPYGCALVWCIFQFPSCINFKHMHFDMRGELIIIMHNYNADKTYNRIAQINQRCGPSQWLNTQALCSAPKSLCIGLLLKLFCYG